MEINKFNDVVGVVTTEEITEGLAVCLTESSETYGFGSREDLPGVKVPTTADEAAKARHFVTFAVDNRSLPIIESYPSRDFALRGGFDAAANAPFTATVHMSYPGNTNGETIPSGVVALAFRDGVFTLPSGSYVYSSDIETVGASLVVDYGSDAGKVKFTSSDARGVNFEVVRFNSDNGELTVKSV